MTLQQLKTKADAKLTDFWQALSAKQDAYFAKHGTYFGFNWTPSQKIVDGVDTDMGELQRPSRKHYAADVSFPITTQLPFQIQVERQHGPNGHGYTAVIRAELPDGRIFMRRRDNLNNDTNWYEYIELHPTL